MNRSKHSKLSEELCFVYRGDAVNYETVSRLRDDLRQNRIHAESQEGEFLRSEAELRQNLEWSNSEGSNQDLFEESSTANSRITPEV